MEEEKEDKKEGVHVLAQLGGRGTEGNLLQWKRKEASETEQSN